jgi:hypothetical protein
MAVGIEKPAANKGYNSLWQYAKNNNINHQTA